MEDTDYLIMLGLPIAIYSWRKNRSNIDTSQIFTLKMVGMLHVSAFLWLFGSIFYIVSADYTLVSHSILLSNLSGVFIIVLNLIRFIPVHSLEIIGTIIVVIFSIIFMNDEGSSKLKGETDIIKGDILALIWMPFYAFYFMVNSEILKKIPAMVILVVINIIQFSAFIIYYMWVSDIGVLFSFDPIEGMLGWASPKYLVFTVFLFGPIAGILGVGGYIILLDYFPAHVVASMFLLEPVSGQIVGIILGQDNFPGIVTYLGALGIWVGLGMVIRGDYLMKKREVWREEITFDEEEWEMSYESILLK